MRRLPILTPKPHKNAPKHKKTCKKHTKTRKKRPTFHNFLGLPIIIAPTYFTQSLNSIHFNTRKITTYDIFPNANKELTSIPRPEIHISALPLSVPVGILSQFFSSVIGHHLKRRMVARPRPRLVITVCHFLDFRLSFRKIAAVNVQ